VDLDPAVRQAVRRVLQSLHKFAKSDGRQWSYATDADWKHGDYFLDVAVNEDWGRIYVTFAAKPFEGRDGVERFEQVQDFLDRELADDPDLVEAIDLVVKSPKEFDQETSLGLGFPGTHVPEDFVETYIR